MPQRSQHPNATGPLAPSVDGPVAAFEEACAGDGGGGDGEGQGGGFFLGEAGGGGCDGGLDAGLDRGLVRRAGGADGDQISGDGVAVVDDDGIGGAAGELVIEEAEARLAGGEASEHRKERGFERIGAGGLTAGKRGEALGLGLVVVGITAQAFDHPADGIGLALQGLAARFLSREGLLEIGDGAGVLGLVIGVEPFGQLGDPAGFGLELSAQLPEGGAACGLLGRGRDGEGDRHGRQVK